MTYLGELLTTCKSEKKILEYTINCFSVTFKCNLTAHLWNFIFFKKYNLSNETKQLTKTHR